MVAARRDGPRQLSRRELPRRPHAPGAGRCADRVVGPDRGGGRRRYALRRAVDLPHRPCRLDAGLAAARRARRRARASASRGCCATWRSLRRTSASAMSTPCQGSCRGPSASAKSPASRRRASSSEIAPELVPPGERALFMYARPAQLYRQHPRGREQRQGAACLAPVAPQRLDARVIGYRRAAKRCASRRRRLGVRDDLARSAAEAHGRPADRMGRLRPRCSTTCRTRLRGPPTISGSTTKRQRSKRSPTGR